MEDFTKLLDGWVDDVGGLVNLTIEEREAISGAGANKAKEAISEATKSAPHFQPGRDTTKIKHLADSVVTGDLEGERALGDTYIGYNPKDKINHGRIARFLNDGTAKYEGDYFYDHALEDAEKDIYGEIFKALEKVQKEKDGGK